MQEFKLFIFILVIIFVVFSLSACAHEDINITTMDGSVDEDISTDTASLGDVNTEYISESDKTTDSNSKELDEEESVEIDYVYVYVCGCVNNEGVYKLRDDERIDDALRAAGGYSEGAARGVINLAAKITDGQKIYFPSESEIENGTYNPEGENISDDISSDNGSSDDGRININNASKEELMTLSGIGEGKAEDIISYREMYGDFSCIEDIKKVSGIGDATFEKLKSQITVDD